MLDRCSGLHYYNNHGRGFPRFELMEKTPYILHPECECIVAHPQVLPALAITLPIEM